MNVLYYEQVINSKKLTGLTEIKAFAIKDTVNSLLKNNIVVGENSPCS